MLYITHQEIQHMIEKVDLNKFVIIRVPNSWIFLFFVEKGLVFLKDVTDDSFRKFVSVSIDEYEFETEKFDQYRVSEATQEYLSKINWSNDEEVHEVLNEIEEKISRSSARYYVIHKDKVSLLTKAKDVEIAKKKLLEKNKWQNEVS